jgi:hypothetical protein
MPFHFFYGSSSKLNKCNPLLYLSNDDWILFLDSKIIVVLLSPNQRLF